MNKTKTTERIADLIRKAGPAAGVPDTAVHVVDAGHIELRGHHVDILLDETKPKHPQWAIVERYEMADVKDAGAIMVSEHLMHLSANDTYAVAKAALLLAAERRIEASLDLAQETS
jgi:hypothetical protein